MNEFTLTMRYDIAASCWVALFHPIADHEGMPTASYATQGRTLHEALEAAYDLLMGLVVVHDEIGKELPETSPLKDEALVAFREELKRLREVQG